jgi:hypothetical protein
LTPFLDRRQTPCPPASSSATGASRSSRPAMLPWSRRVRVCQIRPARAPASHASEASALDVTTHRCVTRGAWDPRPRIGARLGVMVVSCCVCVQSSDQIWSPSPRRGAVTGDRHRSRSPRARDERRSDGGDNDARFDDADIPSSDGLLSRAVVELQQRNAELQHALDVMREKYKVRGVCCRTRQCIGVCRCSCSGRVCAGFEARS